jgi:catechol 2,3-dioxygenase
VSSAVPVPGTQQQRVRVIFGAAVDRGRLEGALEGLGRRGSSRGSTVLPIDAGLTTRCTLKRMAIDPRVDIGHVHLKVSDIDRALAFYRDVLGFEEMQRYGDQAAFISAGGYHHHIGLNTWESKGGSPPPPGTTGLYHVAIRYPDRKTLAQALKQLVDAKIPLSGATDHGVSEAIYLSDPDDNGIELYRDRPKEEWPRAEDGSMSMISEPLDLRALLAEAD